MFVCRLPRVNYLPCVLNPRDQLVLLAEKTLIHTFATHVGLSYDFTDTDGWVENGSTDGRVFTTLKRPFLINRTSNRVNFFFLQPSS